MRAALTRIVITAHTISSFKLPFPGDPRQASHHLFTLWRGTIEAGPSTAYREWKWILLSTQEEKALRRVLLSSLPTAAFEGQGNPGGWTCLSSSPVVWTRDCPCLEESSHLLSTVKTFLDLGFPTSLEVDLPLCSSQTCGFLFCPCSCSDLAAVVLLPHHYSGHGFKELFLHLLVSEHCHDQTGRKILALGCWCLQSATRLYCSELSLHTISVPGVPDIPRLYQNAR